MAIRTASGKVVMRMAERGFLLTIDAVIKGIEELPSSTTSRLIRQFKEDGSVHSEPAKVMEKDPILQTLGKQHKHTRTLLSELLDEGVIPEKKHVDFLMSHRTRYTPELLQEIEKAGLLI